MQKVVTQRLKSFYFLTIFLTAGLFTGNSFAQELPPDTLQAVPKLEIDTLQAVRPTLADTTLVLPETQIDSTIILTGEPVQIDEKADTIVPHSPHKAAVYSAILPGLGQAYNKKYWKIPLVYGGFAAFGYFIKYNHDIYQTSKLAYNHLTDGDPNTDSYMKLKDIVHFNLENPTDVENLKRGLIRQQDYFRRNRDLLVILTVAFYGLNIIDASVDAHFFNWDISDDLTLNLKPTLDQLNYKNFVALNWTIRF